MSDSQPVSTAQHHMVSDTQPMHEQVAKAFINEIQNWTPYRNSYQVFRAFAEIAALTIHQSPYHAGMLDPDDAFDRIEDAYLDAVKPFSRDELGGLCRLYGLASLAFSSYPATDLLGRVFMELDIQNTFVGQYFTPPHVARAMAKMMLRDAHSLIDDKGFATFAEPACGSGCMLIEAANELHELGYNPQWAMMFQATDISRDCFNMAYLQLSWLNIPGVVVHGDTLRMAEWERRPTPMLAIMTRSHSTPKEVSSTQPIPVSMTVPTENIPGIHMPGEQLGFNFTST